MNKYLRIQGQVSPFILEKIGIRKVIQDDTKKWFFVDYANTEFSKNYVFNVQLSENADKIQENIEMKLLKITDQFGNNLDKIPMGFKTICKFQFSNKIPNHFFRMPVLNTWDGKSKVTIIANTKDLTLEKHEEKLEKRTLLNLKLVVMTLNLKGALKKEALIKMIAQQLNEDEDFARKSIDTFIEFGALKTKKDKFVELV